MKLALPCLAILLAAACSEDGQGTLMPVAAPGLTLVSTQGQMNDTARLIADGVRADVTGAWSNTNESIEVAYAVSKPATVPIGGASTWKGAAAPTSGAWDVSVEHPGNVRGRPLLEEGELRLKPDDRPTVLIFFDRSGERNRPALGDEVTITVPMPGGPRPVRFRLAGS